MNSQFENTEEVRSEPDRAIAQLIDNLTIKIDKFQSSYFESAKVKMRRQKEKYIRLPFFWIMRTRLRSMMRRLAAVRNSDENYRDRLKEIVDIISKSKLHGRVKAGVLDVFAEEVERSRNLELQCLVFSGELHEILSERSLIKIKFKVSQESKKFDEAINFGHQLLAMPGVGARELRQIRAEPAMLLEARSLLVERATPPSWSKPGRIAYIASSSSPYAVSGYATRTHGVASGYQQNGFDVHVITRPGFPLDFGPFRSKLTDAEVPVGQDFDGIRYHRILQPSRRNTLSIDYINNAIEPIELKLRELCPEVVIAASDYVNSLPALIAARRAGLRFIYEVRGMWELTKASRVAGFEDTAEFAVSQTLETFVCRNSDKVLTLTDPMMQNLVDRGVSPDLVALMPNGVSAESIEVPKRSEALRRALGLRPDVLTIGYIGSIVEYEGLQDLAMACVEVARKGLDFNLLIVGEEKADTSGQTPITSQIDSLFRSAGIEDRLFMPGRVPLSEVEAHYSLVDISPIPRLPFQVCELVSPIKPVEALAYGKTLIVSDVKALEYFVQDGSTGLMFPKGDVQALANQLERAIGNAELRNRLRESGMTFVRNAHTWSTICRDAAAHIGIEP